MSRIYLFRRVKEGGLGLSHIFVRQIVNRFLFLRDTTDPFLRTFLQVALVKELPEYIVSSSDDVCCVVKGYLKEVVLAVRFLGARFSFEYLSTVERKPLIMHLKEMLFPVPLYRALYNLGLGQDVLCRVKKMVVPASVKTFFFKLHTETLPVKTWMEGKGLFVPWPTNCLLCQKPETIEHVFIECWDAIFFWDVLQRTLKKDFPLTAHGIRFLSVEALNGLPCDLVMLLGLYAIWRSRMAVRHSDVDAKTVSQYFAENVKLLHKVYEMQCIETEWLHDFGNLASFGVFSSFPQPKSGRWVLNR